MTELFALTAFTIIAGATLTNGIVGLYRHFKRKARARKAAAAEAEFVDRYKCSNRRDEK